MTDPKVNPNPQAAAGDPSRVNSTALYVVGCKLPNGLVCELGKPGDDDYRAVRLNGANSMRVVTLDGSNTGYGLTEVPRDFWDAWVKKHKRLDFVRKGMVFAANDEASARAMAQENAKLRTGLEPLDPMKGMTATSPDGAPIKAEVDLDHYLRGKREVAQFGVSRR